MPSLCLQPPADARRRTSAAVIGRLVAWRPGLLPVAALLALLLAGNAVSNAHAQEGSADTIQFRRIFVPADREDEWPRDPGVKYVPVPIKDFDRLVQLLNQGAELPESERRTRLVSARYDARLNDNGVLTGTARFEIVHRQETPALLPLDPMAVAIPVDSRGQAAAYWVGDSRRPATLGVTPEGTMTVLVAESGTLEISWSLQGQSLEQHQQRFLAALPHSPLSECVLDLPDDRELSLGHGVLWEAGPPEDGRRQWAAQLGAEPRLELYIRNAATSGQSVRSATVRQLTRYEITPLGIQISAQWSLDVIGQPLTELTLELAPGVNLLEARQGDIVVQRSEHGSAAAGEPRRETLKFAAPLAGVGRSLRFTALAPLEIGQLQRLPTITAPDLTWREGEAVITISPLLKLQHLETTGCRQSSPLEENAKGEELRVQAFSPNAAIEVDVWYRTSQTQALQATSVELTGSEIRGRTTVELSQPTGERFELTANVPPHWTIDSLESDPPGSIADWTLEPGAEENLLRIRLTRPITAEQGLRLTATGRWLESPVGQSLPVARFWMLRFVNVNGGRELLAIRASAPDELQFPQLPRNLRLDPKQLSHQELALFDGTPQGTLLALDARARQVEVTLQRQPPRFQANISLDATVTPDTLWESYVLRIVPESGGLQRLLVQFSNARPEPLQWSFASDAADDDIVARRLSEPQRVEAGLSTDAEVWLLTWQRARTTPFQLRASRSVPFTEQQMVVSLVSVPEARQQQGEVHIWQFGAGNLSIDGQQLSAMYPDPLPPGESSLQRAAFTYDPGQHVSLAQALTISRSSQASSAAKGLIWKAKLTSLCEPSGRGFHRASYWIENIAAEAFRLQGLAGYDVETIELNSQAAVWSRDDDVLEIELPPRRRFVLVTVQFSTRQPALGMVSNVECPKIRPAEFPQMRTTWHLWLPPGYQAIDPQLAGSEPLAPWRKRIFGTLARPQNEPPFDPFSLKAWENLANNLGTEPAATVVTGANNESGAATTTGLPNATSRTTAIRTVAGPASGVVAAQTSTPPTTSRGAGDVTTAAAPAGPFPWTLGPGNFPVDPTVAWQSFEFEGVLPERVQVLCNDDLNAVGWGLLLAMATVIWWQAAGFTRAAVLVSAFLVLLAAVAPVAWMPITTSLVQGALLGWAMHFGLGGVNRALQPRAGKRDQTATRANGSTARGTTALGKTATGLILAALVATSGLAQEAPQQLVETIHKVFMPADASGSLVGEYCFVPDRLYTDLHLRAARVTREPRDWTLRQASYRVLLQRQVMGSVVTTPPATVAATLEFNVYRDRQTIRVDFGGGNPLRPTDAVLGSDTIPIRWEDGGRYLVFDVPRAGSHRLELQLRPSVRSVQGQFGFDLSIPRVPAARVEVLAPAGVPVELISAIGTVTPPSDSRPMVAELGPASRLALRWRPETADAGSDQFDATELHWLTVKPGSVTLQTRLKLQFGREVPPYVRVAVDPRLRLLQPSNDIQAEDADPTLPADLSARRQIYRIPLASSPLATEVTATASFVLRDTTGVGRLQVPTVTVLGARSTRKHLAVTLDKSLHGRVEIPPTWETLPANLFIAEWNDEFTEPPALAYRVGGTLADGAFWAEPRGAVVAADQVTRISVGTGAAEVEFDADLVTTGGPLFRHRIKLPEGLQIDRVSVRENDTVRNVVWSRPSGGWVTIFLSKPAAKSQKLIVRGTMPLPRRAAATLAVPALELAGVNVLSDYVEFYQQQGVNVTVSAALEDAAAGVMRDGRDRWLGRWWRILPQAGSQVRAPRIAALLPPGTDPAASPSALALPATSAALRAADGTLPADRTGSRAARSPSLPQATMEVTPNLPRVQGTQTVWLKDRDNAWEVGIDLQLTVRQGRLDELSFDIPNTLAEPIDVSIEAVVEVEDDPISTSRRRLVIRPLQSLRGQQHVTIFAQLPVRSGQRVSAPDIRPLFASDLRRFLLLPTRWGEKEVTWQTQRLPLIQWPTDVKLPESLPAEKSQPLGYNVYRIQAPSFQARLQTTEPERGHPSVKLVDISVRSLVDGSYQGVAWFDLNPSGLKECELLLPPGTRLLHASVANMPVMLAPVGAGSSPSVLERAAAETDSTTQTPDAASTAPQQAEREGGASAVATATTEVQPRRWRVPLVSSRLVQRIEVVYQSRGELGKLQAPQLTGIPVEQTLWTVQLPRGVELVGASEEQATESAIDLARARSISGVIAAVSYDESLEEMARWYQPWVQRFHHVLNRLRQSAGRDDDAQAQREVTVLYDFQRDTARQLTLESYFEQAERGRPLVEDPSSLWMVGDSSPQQFFAVVKGSAPELVLAWVDPAAQRRWDQYRAGLAVLLVCGLLAVVVAAARRLDLPLLSPQWLLAAAGVLWWLWLSPSVVGLILVIVSLLTTVPIGWKLHRRRGLLGGTRL